MNDMVGHLKTLARFNINNAGNNRMVLDTMDQNKISSKCAAGEVCNDYRYRSLDGPAVRVPRTSPYKVVTVGYTAAPPHDGLVTVAG